MGTIIWLVGTVLAIMAVLDVFKKNISTGWKIIWSLLLLVTGWIGLAVYYFFAKNKIEDWSK
ncbi:MAG: PLDc N-terminal domain-containing protein [Bacteroidales bacterium]|nr:PLDc N-terminal domain-containing protein [Bacteroidales bacterium]MBQ2913179.1 PLDc N-terminal domain-containing protein [Bacteroidales bacterium]MBR2477264.1 PLDc N-terminal domain-containing protein [Bacteroidales bacterium]